MRVLIWLVALVLMPSLVEAQQPGAAGVCGRPIALEDGWPIATPESAGMDGARLCGIADRLKAQDANVHAVVIARRGKLVFEQYFPGYDDPWGVPEGQFKFDATTKHDMRSVSKSVASLLVGIAIDRKLIASADEPVLKYFSRYADVKSAGWEKISLRHLNAKAAAFAQRYGVTADPEYPYLPYGSDAKRSLIAKAVISAAGVERTSFLPVVIDRKLRPEPLQPADPRFKDAVNYMEWASEGYDHQFTIEGDEVHIGAGGSGAQHESGA